MTPEERIAYNKVYYDKHRTIILQKALKKVVCQFCNRSVIYNTLPKHKKSNICKKKQLELNEDKQRLLL